MGGGEFDREGGHPGGEDGEVEEAGGHWGDYNGEGGIEVERLNAKIIKKSWLDFQCDVHSVDLQVGLAIQIVLTGDFPAA